MKKTCFILTLCAVCCTTWAAAGELFIQKADFSPKNNTWSEYLRQEINNSNQNQTRVQKLIAAFSVKWMTHKKTDVCLQEEATEQVVVHRNSWDVITRFLMGYHFDTENGTPQSAWTTSTDINTGESYGHYKPFEWTRNNISAMRIKFVMFYQKEYAKRPSMAPQGGAKSTGPSRADDIDAPWDKTNNQLFAEFYKELVDIENAIKKANSANK